jgi:ElaB/YqjD/DUF883 family membrane-anchored ribosome-binding protein
MEIAIFFMLGMLFVLVGILVPVVLNIMSRINRIETTATDSLTQTNLNIDHIHLRFEEERRGREELSNQLHRVMDSRSDSMENDLSNLRSKVDSNFDKLNSYIIAHVERIESNIATTEGANKLKKQQING